MKRHYILYTILFVIICPITLWADNYVIFNQIMYDSPNNEDPSISPHCNGEYIELYNAGTSAVSLRNWVLSGSGVTEQYTFWDDITLAAGSYLILACRRGTDNNFQLSDLYSLPSGSNYTILYQSIIMLSNEGETLTLCNAQNDTIDRMFYDGDSHITNPSRLYAPNRDNLDGDSCVSLHRTWVEFDVEGKVIPGTSQWKTYPVSFAVSMLPSHSYHETYITGSQPLPAGENYILSVTPLDPTTRIDINDGRVSLSSGIRTSTTMRYIDGLGRDEETIALGATPGKNDLVTVTEHYGKHRVSRQWLPVVMETEGQRMVVADVISQAQTDYGDSRPYADVSYENAASQRPTERYLPGSTYASYPATQTYSLNTEGDQVRLYTVKNNNSLYTDGSFYSSSTLYKNTVSDEEGKSMTTYIDKQGRTIMEERAGYRTYYVYDNVGHLRFILPHIPSSKLSDGEYALSDSTLRRAAYCYKYDERGNVIYKRLPGCEPQYMVYDKAGHLILSQDGNQRPLGKWTLYTYDSIGRNLYTAEVSSMEDYEYLMSYFAERWYVEHYGNNPSSTSLPGTGYASSFFPKGDVHLLTVNYYDDYHYLTRLATPVRQKLRFKQESGFGLQYENATGMLTGTRIYSLSEQDDYTVTSYYYDTKGRVVQSRSAHNTNGHRTATSTEYLFDGSIAQLLSIQGTDSSLVREHYRYDYDHAGRVKQTYYKLNNEEEILLSAFSYDSIGHLAQNLLHNKQDAIVYSYDIRNMLTETQNKHFSERLYYADSVSQIANATPCHNGNISVARISSADSIYLFAYTYDPLNRLLQSKRLTGYGSINSELFSYDNAGNIQTLKRFNNNSLIDDLDYDYGNAGNQLLAITDRGVNADRYNIIEYHNGNSQADTTMRYDANGNLIYDADRGISVIHYNMLNLPDTIQFINGNQIVNLYDAVGNKYKSIVYTVVPTVVTTHYAIEPYTFETDSVVFSITEYNGNIETVCSVEGDTIQRIHNSVGYYINNAHYHYIKDHLGNICAVISSAADTLVQSTIYYASGVPMTQSFGREAQPYLYNGKEFIESHGLNTYDYGFRGYYSPIGRFTSIDPLAEQTPWMSPYSYAGNNFINAIDWMGLGGLTSGYTSSYGWMAQDAEGNVVGWGDDNNDWHVYEVDKDWDGTYKGLDGHSIMIGWEVIDKNGHRQQYIKGRPTYWLGSITQVSLVTGIVYGSTALMHGNKSVEDNIDDTRSALLHYIFGFGRDIALGNKLTRLSLLANPIFQAKREEIINGELESTGNFNIDLTNQVFHIGRTSVYYYSTETYTIFCLGVTDKFCDALYMFEKSEHNPNGITPDGKGWKLEFGIPYDYIPLIVMIPN